MSKSDKGSTERFGFEWERYNKIIPEYESQFLKWVFPLTKKDFKNKKILDAGCGIGRNSYWPLIYGAKHLTCFDYNKKTIETARKNLSMFKNVAILFDSIYTIPYQNKFDISFSIGVIHHLEFPKKAIKNLIRATKKGGKILIWVYGYEGNEWIVKYINPIRKFTSRIPPGATHFLSYLFSIPLYLYIKSFPRRNPYFLQLKKFRFWHIHSIVFDQLIPKIANYWTKEQAFNLLKSSGLINIKIFRVNNNSWTVIGEK